MEKVYITQSLIDFESSQEDLIWFMANKKAISEDREAIVRFFELGTYSHTMPLALDTLYTYSKLKYSAMTCREEGLIQAAKYLEDLADEEYSKLPKFARW